MLQSGSKLPSVGATRKKKNFENPGSNIIFFVVSLSSSREML
jgi:hypothetical protein